MTEKREAETKPSKSFFVSMLTRDIDLRDAILDLLDNCIDGAVRSGEAKGDPERPYDGYWAKLTLSADWFSLEDNCGGIPIGTARHRAFRLGRPPGKDHTDADGKTVGVYGIGMKRAIFKLGRNAKINSNGEDPFQVVIDDQWLSSDDWQPLELAEYAPDSDSPSGTTVSVGELYETVKRDLSSKDWIEKFKRYIANHYALIISKGFEVSVIADGISSEPIRSAEFALAVTGDLGGGGVQPFIYRGEVDGVSVHIVAGLLRKPLNAKEIEEAENEHAERSLAGWTIACNDRVVVSRDRTFLTGWGTGGVAQYHGQYSVIAGIALLYADDVEKLPLTTTKRGLDGSSAVYARTLDIMRDATKKLTAFTNAYKTDEDRREILEDAPKRTLAELRSFDGLTSVQRGTLKGFQVLTPDLPRPVKKKRNPRVTFEASRGEIGALKDFFEDDGLTDNEVGRSAFEFALETAGYKGP
ncbi:ATP-binding protein [Roseovarius sp. SCSIO 43702]|uniref:ATP-binding protein n=1 Tax=Roseovarius sp. SCSIO 43702 TaxID=2823043 RepID=UPI001C72C15E|nr:ATP-binding protein [Roseovarius sp. SCSIO 43702]QYX55948.1 ATP-binding protein [Roseovarius sp. SCSIO 43702]